MLDGNRNANTANRGSNNENLQVDNGDVIYDNWLHSGMFLFALQHQGGGRAVAASAGWGESDNNALGL